MTSEAAVLGTPSIRCNTLAGQLSYLEELEHNRPETALQRLERLQELLQKFDAQESVVRQVGEILSGVEPEDLLRFGLIPEFVGRLPVIATLEDLDEDSLVEILGKPRNALVKQYQRLFDMEDVRLELTDDALRGIAQKAITRKTGARGLRSIMEAILLDAMYELPGLEGVEEIVINREVVEGNAKPLYIYSDRRGDVGTSA